MTSVEFARAIWARFRERGWGRGLSKEGLQGPAEDAAVIIDFWASGAACRPYEIEKCVCEFVRQHGLDPRTINFGSFGSGFLIVQLRTDLAEDDETLADRSIWRRGERKAARR